VAREDGDVRGGLAEHEPVGVPRLHAPRRRPGSRPRHLHQRRARVGRALRGPVRSVVVVSQPARSLSSRVRIDRSLSYRLLLNLSSSGLRPVTGALPHHVPGGRRAGGHRPGAEAGLHAQRQRLARRAPARLQHVALVDLQGRQPSVRDRH
jgi:hypothetical protein